MRGSGRSLPRGPISRRRRSTRFPHWRSRLGLRELLIKDETARFGLNAFKTAGATFAVAALIDRGAIRRGDTLVCASEGNHGRAVARAARDAGCAARVYMAASVAPSRVAAIEGEGAQVTRVDGSYDDAVRRMAGDASAHGWTVISDTGWAGYDDIPRLIMLGYTRLLDEAAAQWAAPPDAIFVPAGVGGLLAAAASWARLALSATLGRTSSASNRSAPACVQAAVTARTRNARCPARSTRSWEACAAGRCRRPHSRTLSTLVDGYVAIEDEWAYEAIRALARPQAGDVAIAAGASGAASLGGLMATLHDASLGRFSVAPRAGSGVARDGHRDRRRHRTRGLRPRARRPSTLRSRHTEPGGH